MTNYPGQLWRGKWTALSGPLLLSLIAPFVQGCLAHKKYPPPYDHAVALCLGTCGDPRGVGVSCERGTPVEHRHRPFSRVFSNREPRMYFIQHFSNELNSESRSSAPHARLCKGYRGTSLTRTSLPVGPYSSICLGPYGGPRGGCCFL